MSQGRRILQLAAAFCALALLGGASLASAEVSAPQAGAWKGMTKQGYAVYFRVESDRTVTNFRFTYREPICGKQSVHLPEASLATDEAGHFGGTIETYYLEFEGTFTAPNRVQGKIIALEHTGVPGCLRKVVGFTAYPRNTLPPSRMAARPATQNCKAVEFGRPPEGGAYAIHATGIGCDVAREVARVTKARRLGPETAQRKRSYSSHGFDCVGMEPNWLAGIPPIHYTCKRDGAKITFNREVLY